MTASSQIPPPASPVPGAGGTPSLLLGDETATDRLGRILAAALRVGDVVALDGELGAGKTRLVRAVAEAAGVAPEEIGSPTFTLVREYATGVDRGDAPPFLFHLDAYRLSDADEYELLGPEEFADRGAALIEWAARVADALPTDRLSLRLTPTGETSRRAEFAAGGPRSAALLDAVRGAFCE